MRYAKFMLPVFADPKTDFVFKRIFGTEAYKPLLIELLNALLELAEAHRIVDLEYLTPEQRVSVRELKHSIIDVKCTDATGTRYVGEMQVLNVEGFEKRVVYNASRAYIMQLRDADDYPLLCDVVGVTICDLILWPEPAQDGGPPVPMVSRWRLQEHDVFPARSPRGDGGGAVGLPQIQYVSIELPKYGVHPEGTVDRWAFFFREANNLEVAPPELAVAPFCEALEVARTAHCSAAALGRGKHRGLAPQPYPAQLYQKAVNPAQNYRIPLGFSNHQNNAIPYCTGGIPSV